MTDAKIRDGFDPRHPVAQNLIGRNARLSIALDIVRDILADDCEPTPITAEHWAPIHDQAQSVVRERNELRQEVERLRADGARYAYLRDHMLHGVSHPHGSAIGMSEVLFGDDPDEAIDAAMKEKRK